MDGPRVNWAFLDKFKAELDIDPGNAELLELGSCSLHIIHGAFQTGSKASGFDISHLLTSLYYLFHDSPACTQDFQKITSCTKYPLKFCAHRWLENATVAERAIEIWPHVQKYVRELKKKPENRSFATIEGAAKILLC
jgi:hypothetical protein